MFVDGGRLGFAEAEEVYHVAEDPDEAWVRGLDEIRENKICYSSLDGEEQR